MRGDVLVERNHPEDIEAHLAGGVPQEILVAANPVEGQPQLVAADHLVDLDHLLDQGRRLHPPRGGIADDQEGVQAAHDLPVDLLQSGLTIDEDGVEALRKRLDRAAQEGVDRAVAAQRLRASHRQHREVVHFGQGFEGHVVDHLADLRLGLLLSASRRLDDLLSNLAHGAPHAHAEGAEQPHRGIGVDQEQAAGSAAPGKGSRHQRDASGLARASLSTHTHQSLAAADRFRHQLPRSASLEIVSRREASSLLRWRSS